MPRRSLIFLIVALLRCIPSSAQDEFRSNHLELRFGWMHSRMIDDGYSKNLLLRGTNSKLNLAYTRETSRYHFRFSLEGTAGKLKSKSGNLPSEYYTAQPSIDYLRKVSDHNFLLTSSHLYVGATVSSMNYLLIDEPVFDNARLLSLHGLYLDVRERMQLDETRYVQLTLRLPAAVYVNSLLWNGGASHLSHRDGERWLQTLTTNGSFRYFEVLRNVELTADYNSIIGKHAELVVGYKFRYFSDGIERATSVYSNELLIGLKIRL